MPCFSQGFQSNFELIALPTSHARSVMPFPPWYASKLKPPRWPVSLPMAVWEGWEGNSPVCSSLAAPEHVRGHPGYDRACPARPLSLQAEIDQAVASLFLAPSISSPFFRGSFSSSECSPPCPKDPLLFCDRFLRHVVLCKLNHPEKNNFKNNSLRVPLS